MAATLKSAAAVGPHRSPCCCRAAMRWQPGMKKRRVLIVDDEPSVRESLRMVLKARYDILTAASGNSALELIGVEPVDVVLLDILMPGPDGLEVLERLKDQAATAPVIMLTATKTV